MGNVRNAIASTVARSMRRMPRHATQTIRKKAVAKGIAGKTAAFRVGTVEAAKVKEHEKCYFCGLVVPPPNRLTYDHFIPKSRGGSNHIHNIVIACHRCNNDKADNVPSEEEIVRLLKVYPARERRNLYKATAEPKPFCGALIGMWPDQYLA